MPKILILSRHIESASFRQRIALYFNNLSQAGIEYEVKPLPAESYKTLKLFNSISGFDVVFLHKKRLSLLERFFLRKNAKKIIYDFDDAVMFDPQKPQQPNTKKLKKFAATIKMADKIIAGNSFLADFAKKFNSSTVILPTGLNIAEYEIGKKKSDEKIRLVWIGSDSNLIYLKQIKEVLEQTGKKYKNVILRIICNEFFDLVNMPVEKIQWSLKTQIPDLVNSDIGLAPLPDDNFTKGKCGFKILQYFAASLPSVASSVGVNAEFVRNGTNGFLPENSQQWIDSISRLIEDSDLRRKLGQQAKTFAKNYDVSVLGKKFIDIISGAG
jgi:glycosyltransferase involved in cell wall biosynthesis